MPAVLTPDQATIVTREMLAETSLIRIVVQHRGIKDTELAMLSMAELGSSVTPNEICQTIRSLISQGRLIGIDYHLHENIGTFVLPANARAVLAMPVQVTRRETRH